VRGNFRFSFPRPTPSPCSTDVVDDRDDLVFAVDQEADTTAPTVSLTSPAEGTTFSGASTVTLGAIADDGFGVTRVEFYAGSTLLGTDTQPPYAATWSTVGFASGTHTLTAKAYDAAGNTATSSVSVTVDRTGPALSFTSPLAAAVRGTVSIQYSASDNYQMHRVVTSVDSTVIHTDFTAPYALTWDSTTKPDGAHLVTGQAYDVFGNVTTATLSIQVDNTSPTVSITAPAAGTVITTQTTITASASDNHLVARVEFYDGTTLLGTDTTAPYSLVWRPSAPKGSRTLTTKAYDVAGNVTTSAGVTVQVK
jgi:hypothetical protein